MSVIQTVRMLPNDQNAERSVLGSILIDKDCADSVFAALRQDQFYSNAHELIYGAMMELDRSGSAVDAITLVSYLERKKRLRSVGGAFYITGLTEEVPSAANVLQYAEIVREKSYLREMIYLSRSMAGGAYDLKESKRLAIDAEKKLRGIYEEEPEQSFEDLMNESVESIYNPNLILTGFSKIDSVTGGLTRGEITTIASRPGHGKTTTAANLISRLCGNDNTVIIFNREMMNKQMIQKLIMIEARGRISGFSLRRGISERDREIIEEIRSDGSFLRKYSRLYMFDRIKTLDGSIIEINKIRPDVIIDDYIQLVKVRGEEDKRLGIVRIMGEYKWAAKNNDAAVVVLSQLNRSLDNRTDKRPRLSDLAESGSIENDSEAVIFAYRDWLYNTEDSDDGPNGIRYIVSKNRFGTPATVVMGWAGDYSIITDTVAEAERITP